MADPTLIDRIAQTRPAMIDRIDPIVAMADPRDRIDALEKWRAGEPDPAIRDRLTIIIDQQTRWIDRPA